MINTLSSSFLIPDKIDMQNYFVIYNLCDDVDGNFDSEF